MNSQRTIYLHNSNSNTIFKQIFSNTQNELNKLYSEIFFALKNVLYTLTTDDILYHQYS